MERQLLSGRVRKAFLDLGRSSRFLVVLIVLEIIHRLAAILLGTELPSGGLVRFLLVIALALRLFSGCLFLSKKILWRVRNRLLVTYVLVGVVPIVLVLAMVSIIATILMGQITGYLLISSLDRRYEALEAAASNIAVSTALGNEPVGAAAEALNRVRQAIPALNAVVEVADQPLPPQVSEALVDIPEWIEPGFKGLLVSDTNYLLVARSAEAPASVSVLAYEILDPTILAQVLPGFGTIQLLDIQAFPVDPDLDNLPDLNNLEVELERLDVEAEMASSADGGFLSTLSSSTAVPLAEPLGFWDLPIAWPSRIPAQAFEDGTDYLMAAVVGSRPSLVVTELFSTFELAGILGTALILVAVAFLSVEAGSLLFIGRLTRSITRTVKDTYDATKQVEAGNLSHRIPIRNDDQLNSLASSFNGMTENVQQLIAEVKDKERQDLELQIAREVQVGLFPKQRLHLENLEVAGVCRPARLVSGDYYDFVSLDERKAALIIGDISGKGISAALLMASLQSSVRSQIMMAKNTSSPDLSPADVVGLLNKQLYQSTTPERYATFYYSIYDDDTGELCYTNTGHVPPVVIREGSAVQLEPNGTIVGAFPEIRYEESRIRLDPGDLMVATTDGVTECENAAGDQFGDDRLIELLLENSNKPLDELIDIIVHSVNGWAHDLAGQDDTTLLLARRVS